MKEKRIFHARCTERGIDNLMVAIGERAVKDYTRALKKYIRLSRACDGLEQKAKLFRADYSMREAASFFLKDPYDIFPNGGGTQIISLLEKRYGYAPAKVPTKEEYKEIMKRLEK